MPVRLARQGDVLFVRVAALPVDATVVQEGGDIILAHGEETGHHHRVLSPHATFLTAPSAAQLVNAAQQVLRAPQERQGVQTQVRGYLDIKEPTAVTHEEHAPVPLDPGIWKVVIQREYLPAERPQTLAPALGAPSREAVPTESTWWSMGSWRNVAD